MDTASSLRAPPLGQRLNWRITPLRLAVGLTILTLALRSIDVGSRPLWLDEAYSAWFSSFGWHDLWTQVPRYETHPPFYYSLLKLWRSLFGGTAVGLRSLSLLFTAATVPLVIAASAELERQQPSGRPLLRAAIAAFLIACSPMLVMVGEEARPYPLLIFAYALAVLGLLRLLREFAAGEPGGWHSWLMLAAGTEIGLWAHALGLLYAICLAAALAPAWLKQPVLRERLIRGLAAAGLIALLYIPCLMMVMNRAGDWGNNWLPWGPQTLLQLVTLYTIPGEVLTIVSAAAALTMVLLAFRAVNAAIGSSGWNADRAAMLLWWGPPILAILVSQFALPIFLPRTLTATLVPAYLVLSGALARTQSPRERLILAAALFITLPPAALQVPLRPVSERWDEVGAYLKRHVAAGDEVWLYPNDSVLPLREAGATGPMRGIPGDYPAVGAKGVIRVGTPSVLSVTREQAAILASDPSLKAVPVVWLVTRQSGLFDPNGDMPAALARVRRPGPIQEWNYITVRPYYRR
jgi:mannosyltransferase